VNAIALFCLTAMGDRYNKYLYHFIVYGINHPTPVTKTVADFKRFCPASPKLGSIIGQFMNGPYLKIILFSYCLRKSCY
jgi:hypothetical protein